ncbi:MAG: hypothetical protein OXF72_04725 [Gammaproteobacteria bacterium]|nr:hypothetical protein [Gammaproteobacteria bacterium]
MPADAAETRFPPDKAERARLSMWFTFFGSCSGDNSIGGRSVNTP